jgi:hypothetical protein
VFQSSAREFYDEKTAGGDHSALRKLGNRWLGVLWHCLAKGVLYDEASCWTGCARTTRPRPGPSPRDNPWRISARDH